MHPLINCGTKPQDCVDDFSVSVRIFNSSGQFLNDVYCSESSLQFLFRVLQLQVLLLQLFEFEDLRRRIVK